MNILKEVLKHEVFPALGCTEPIAIAYAVSVAADKVSGEPVDISINVDPGIFKNGFAVTLPNTNGEKGNLLAGVLGALIKKPHLKMEILKCADKEMIRNAKGIIEAKKARLTYDISKRDLFIEVVLKTKNDTCTVVIEEGHTNLTYLNLNDVVLINKRKNINQQKSQAYKNELRSLTIGDLIDLVEASDKQDIEYIRQGVAMNLKIAEAGQTLKKVGYYISNLVEIGYLPEDIFSSSKILVASASDARMEGLNYPVMSSGGSGNQGIVAILVPYNVGKTLKISDGVNLKSIALSHLINSYIKCFTGDLSPLCGCSIAAGVGAAVAMVYQRKGKELSKIYLAVNNLISDLGGMLCDGAKGGCALKVVSSAESAIRTLPAT